MIEETLIALWSQALEREVAPHDAFLDLGGDSLSAASVAAGVHERLGVDLDLRVFAANITLSALAALIEQQRSGASGDELPPLERGPRMGPLSIAQERSWRAGASDPADPSWRLVVAFRISGPLDVEVLRASVEHLVRRHEMLRTTFVEWDGRPTAVVLAPGRFELEVRDLRSAPEREALAEQAVDEQLAQPFDLERGPLLRLLLLQLGDEEYRLIRSSHQLIHDALSWRVFFRELAVLYEALRDGRPSPLSEDPPLQYLDFAMWERAALRSGASWRREAELEWWARRFREPVAPLRLPFQRSEPAVGAPAADGFLRWGIEPRHGQRLDELARGAGATYYVSRLAIFSALLALESEAEELLIGTPMSTRNRAELQNVIGMFINFTMLRLQFRGEPTLRSWLGEVRRVVIDTSVNVRLPIEDVMRELGRRQVERPRPHARFVAWPTVATMHFGGLEVEPLPQHGAEAAGFRLGVNRSFEDDRCWAEFDPKVHDPDGVRQFLTRLRAFAAAASAEPDRPLRDLHSAVRSM